ncbi:MAG TPA: hypothetical protein PLW68_12285, partial [Casimicrobiaceae bacterium]|nr:hypothetical protein [Casimicrobiaceae bacterium]
MKKTYSFLPVCFAGVLSLAPLIADAQVKFFGVGDLPGGIVQSEVRDTARIGNVLYAVGGSSAVGGVNDTPFLWTSTGGITPLPPLAAGVTDSTDEVVASAITPDAAYIAASARFNPSATNLFHAVRATTSGLALLDLGTLPGFPQLSAADAISSDGTVLYGFALHAPGLPPKVQAVRYTTAGPTITAIPFLNGTDTFSFTTPRGTSADGSVMVGAGNSIPGIVPGHYSGFSAFRFVQGTGVSAIPPLAGGTWNAPLALSPDGNLVLVAGDSPSSPNGETYLYNATTAAITPLGTPAKGWVINGLGGMIPDGSVVVAAFFDPEDPAGAAFLRNASGWHVIQTIVAGAGVDLTGWNLKWIAGISTDGTRIWGSGSHNGNAEGWIAEFPVGYLAAYGASLPAQSIAGAWSGSNNTAEGAYVLAFLNNGTYIEIDDAKAADLPGGFDGYERGTYAWDPVTKAFTLTTLIDTNGDSGLSAPGGVPAGSTATRLNDIVTLNFPGAGGGSYSAPLIEGSSP